MFLCVSFLNVSSRARIYSVTENKPALPTLSALSPDEMGKNGRSGTRRTRSELTGTRSGLLVVTSRSRANSLPVFGGLTSR